ncbi:ABC transporter permease [Tessaracoccus sp. Y36]
MWRQAVSELRLHPGRFVATLIAIAISVGFIAAISVFVNSEQTALGKSTTMPLANADLFVTTLGLELPELVDTLEGVDGVRAVHEVPFGQSTILNFGDRSEVSMLYSVPPADLQWSELVDGRWPTSEQEIVLSRAGLDSLGADIGDSVSPDHDSATAFTIVGATDDPASLWSTVGYLQFGPEYVSTDYALVLDDRASAADAFDGVSEAAASLDPDITVRTADAERQTQLDDLTNQFDIFTYLLQTFGVVALLVGMITIANTFAILVAQRRRQVGLLRAVGASPGQVMGRIVVESLLLGVVGSVLGIALGFGVALIGGSITGSLYWGLDVRWGELLIALLAGVAATMISAIAPAIVASRVKPLEALQAVPTEAQARRAGLIRTILVALTAAIGVFLVVMSRINTEWSVLWAVGAGAFLTVAVLAAAPFFVPPLLKLLGAVFGRTGPTARLAFTNAARNPKRAAATATALMLAVGLIVTLQVALATARTSGTESIHATYPVDFTVSFADDEVPADLIERLEGMEGVAGVRTLPAKQLDNDVVAFDRNGLLRELGKRIAEDAHPQDGEVVVSEGSLLAQGQDTVTLPGANGDVTLKVVTGAGLEYYQASVSTATLEQLAGDPVEREIWITLKDRGDLQAINQVIKVLETVPDAFFGASGAGAILVLNQVLDVMLIVLTGLLGVAMIIALVGVSNTLGLSVIERQRESALLRALGMQRSGLRWMLLVEALALVGVGVLIGLVAGMFFGWLGVSSTLLMMPGENVQLHFSIDALYTAGLIAVCLVAAVLASLLPGQKAASAPPTEALAAD